MTTPLESIENTVTRLRVRVGPHGYYADKVAHLEAELEEAHDAESREREDLLAWEKILDTLRADKADLERFKEEFLRRHHPELTETCSRRGSVTKHRPDCWGVGQCVPDSDGEEA